MNSYTAFQIVCSNCACLSIKIEEPLTSSREAIVFCGDCGTPRGTVGALRELAVQQNSDIVFPLPSTMLSINARAADEPQSLNGISMRYAEVRRLRQQVKIAEWHASESKTRAQPNR